MRIDRARLNRTRSVREANVVQPVARRRPRREMGLLPPLKRGQDFWIVVENSFTLIAVGWEKGQALATALNLAGYRLPAA